MLDSGTILRLYSNVLSEDIIRHQILERQIRFGVRDMAQTYAAEFTNFGSDVCDRKVSDYNIPGFRCAYLHKYAPLHTYIVLDIMSKILRQEMSFFKSVLTSKQFKLCCLGGGPGSDAIGVLAALGSVFASFRPSVTVIDCMGQWKYTFDLIISRLRRGDFGMMWNNLLRNADFNYIEADLLQNMTVPVNNAINAASLITMVKFISAAACRQTESMVEKIFQKMRPGALLLFIDNAAGGFTQIIERVSKKLNFKVVAGPYRHMEYTNEDLKVERFGYTSCFRTKVTVLLMQKPDINQNKMPVSSKSISYDQNIPNLKGKLPLRDVQNINNVPAQIRISTQEVITKPLLGNKILGPSPSNCSDQNIPASKMKAPLHDAKNINRVPAQTQDINNSLLRNNILSTSHSKCSSQNISVPKRKTPFPSDGRHFNETSSQSNNIHVSIMHITSQEKTDKSSIHNNRIRSSSIHNNRIRSSTCRSIINENPIRPFSNVRTAKVSDLNYQQEKFSSRMSSNCVVSSQPLITTPSLERNSYTDNSKDNSEDTCCSCCVIS